MIRLVILILVCFGCGSVKGDSYTDNRYVKDLEALAYNIYYEARNQSKEGQIAVAWATKNRVLCNSKWFPDNYYDVVHQRFPGQDYQFSWVTKYQGVYPLNLVSYGKALVVSLRVMGDEIPDPTGGAIFYKADYSPAKWKNRTKTVTVGTHTFYTQQGVCTNETN